MKEYCYCSVQPKGMSSVYSYIADEDQEIRIGTCVEVPFGPDNHVIKGIVVTFGYFTEENAPWPLEKTKHILRVITSQEYLQDDTATETDHSGSMQDPNPDDQLSESDKKEIAQAMTYMLSRNYEEMFKWATEHHNRVDSPGIMKVVCSCYEMCVAQNNTDAALNLGTLYYTGQGVPQDFKKAAQLYEIAASAGDVRALCNLGYCYYYGRHQEADYAKAFQCFNLGAVLHDDPNCLYKLGDMYRDGKFVKENGKYAFQLYLRAYQTANLPNADQSCLPDIQFRLGRELLEGDIVEKNVDEALALLVSALTGFYQRRKTDSYVQERIQETKELIAKAEHILDQDV